MTEPARLAPWRRLVSPRALRIHGYVFGLGMGLLAASNFMIGGGWWTFWPMYGWAMLLAMHFMVCRSLNVDHAWVEERADDLRLRSYDLGHIRDIQDRVADGDPSVRAADERDR